MDLHPTARTAAIATTALRAAAAVILLWGLAPAPGHAAPTVHFGLDNTAFPSPASQALAARDAFVAAAGAATITTQTYESEALGDLAPVTSGVLANGVGVTVTNSTVNGYLRVSSGAGAFDTYPVSGSRYLEALSDQGTTYFTAEFDQPVHGLGFFVSDVSDWLGTANAVDDIEVVLTTVSGNTWVFDLTPDLSPSQLVNGNLAFWGVLDAGNTFTSLAVRSGSNLPGGDALGFDDFMVSLNRVPEPASLALVLVALTGAGWRRRRT